MRCDKCDKPALRIAECLGPDGSYPSQCGKRNTLCADCGPFKLGIKEPYMKEAKLLCVSCHAKQREQYTCTKCAAVTTKHYTCVCCGVKACKECDPQYIDADVSPITLYGSGLSVGRHAKYCSACAKSEKEVQNSWRHTGEHHCDLHSQAAFIITQYPWVLYSNYTKPNGESVLRMEVLDKTKNSIYEFTNEAEETIKAYCEAHPEKHVTFDGKEYSFPSIAHHNV